MYFYQIIFVVKVYLQFRKNPIFLVFFWGLVFIVWENTNRLSVWPNPLRKCAVGH